MGMYLRLQEIDINKKTPYTMLLSRSNSVQCLTIWGLTRLAYLVTTFP